MTSIEDQKHPCGYSAWFKPENQPKAPISLEDHATMRLAGESNVCLCDEYASLVLE